MEQDREKKTDTKNLLIFPLNNQLYALDISVVEELIPLPEFVPIDSNLPFLKGIIDLRGTIVPLVDLKIRLKLTTRPYELDDAVVIVKVRDLRAGLIVDAGSFVLEFPAREISSSPEIITTIEQNFLAGWGRCEKGLFILLDPEKLLTPNDRGVLQKLTPPSS